MSQIDFHDFHCNIKETLPVIFQNGLDYSKQAIVGTDEDGFFGFSVSYVGDLNKDRQAGVGRMKTQNDVFIFVDLSAYYLICMLPCITASL